MYINQSAEAFQNIMMYLQNNRVPYLFRFTANTKKVESAIGDFMTTTTSIRGKEASFINKVKRHVIKNKIYKKIENDVSERAINSIKYFRYKSFDATFSIDNVFEVDINKAYWNLSHHMGIINDEIYHEGLRISEKHKIVRMIALGALAKTEEVYSFDGKTEKYLGTLPKKKDRKTEFLWFKICREIGRIMFRCKQAAGDDFLFYWVDGIYLSSSDAVERVQDILADENRTFKVKEIYRIVCDAEQRKINVYDTQAQFTSKKPRPFQLPKLTKKITNV